MYLRVLRIYIKICVFKYNKAIKYLFKVNYISNYHDPYT